MSLSATVKASISARQTNPLDLGAGTFPLDVIASVAFEDGAGANQSDLLFSDRRTIAASGSENLDLAGVLSSAFGATLTFARIKAILVKAASGNTNNVNVTRPASNGVPLFLAASDGIAVQPGGAFLWVAPSAAGVVVTAGTGDILTVANSGGGTGVTYDIVILGAAT